MLNFTRLLPLLPLLLWAILSTELAAQHADGEILQREPVAPTADWPEGLAELASELRVERLVYASSGFEVEAFMVSPKELGEKPLPAIVYCRGGNRDFGAVNAVRAVWLFGSLARSGYVVVASNYRGNGEHGAKTYPAARTCEECGSGIGGHGREEFGGAEVDDVLALLSLVDSLPEADGDRVGIYGWSRGGMMTYLALRHSDRFRAAIVGAGMADLAAGLEERPGMEAHVYSELIPGWEDDDRRAAAVEARSAVRWAEEFPETTPLLIMHGSADWRVSPRQALDLAGKLLEAKRPYRLMMFEGGDHALSEFREEVDEAVAEWFDRYLRDGAKLPDLEPHGH